MNAANTTTLTTLTDSERVPMPATDTGLVPASSFSTAALANVGSTTSLIQPIRDVPSYLATRKPVAHFNQELPLFLRLPSAVAREVRALLNAFDLVTTYRRAKDSVQAACGAALKLFSQWNWSLTRFRARYELWLCSGDWFVLVNRTKAGGEFQDCSRGLPEAFLDHVAKMFAAFGRADGKRQAILAIRRHWLTGRDVRGNANAIPGYESEWATRNPALTPAGWHYSNIIRQIKARGKFTAGIQALTHESRAAATQHLPQVIGTRRGLRFLEVVTFDDVRTDWMVLNTTSGRAEELWLLVARDLASAMVLGFVMHPATIREDGKAAHLGLAQMKQLAGWMLERYPLPPYVSTWKIERGTASLSDGMRLALGELLGDRIAISFTSMIGGNSPVGYKERAKGNSRGKASHESHNRLFHTQGAFIAGQTGNRWDIRPADLQSRIAEAEEIWQLSHRLPAHLRGAETYPLLTLNQAREHLFRISNEQNSRTDHALEDFEEVLERHGDRIIKRMERPIERAARLSHGYEWTPISPHIIRAFYEHTEKSVTVNPRGEIEFQTEGRTFIFANAGLPLAPETKALAYFHPDDPRFLHLTNGKGAFLGTWVRRERVPALNDEMLRAAFRYTATARAAADAAAQALTQPQRADLDTMRESNAELMRLAEFTDITPAPEAIEATIGSPVGAALTAVSAAVKGDASRANVEEKQIAKQTAAARKNILDNF